MDVFGLLGVGFAVAFQPENLLACFIGVLIGTLVGVLPGIGPVSGIALLLPVVYGRDPTTSLIMLAGIYYGAMYGGSTTSILMKIPGESASVMTAIDGHEMAKQGRAGVALGIAAFGSFIAGTLGLVGLVLLAPVITTFALRIGPPEYVLIVTLSLFLVSALTGTSVAKGIIATVLGLLISLVGVDSRSGDARFTFGQLNLLEGVSFIVVAIAVYAIAEVMGSMNDVDTADLAHTKVPLLSMFPSRSDWRASRAPILRGTVLGFFIGVLPGAGATIASFLSYGVEKSVSKHPERFGKGAIEGVAGPESANNSASAGAMVPLLTLGVPGSGSTAVLLAAFLLVGITPGPLLFDQHPDVAWGLIASMYVGNLMLVVLNVPLIAIFLQVLKLRRNYMTFLILLVSAIGVYALRSNLFDLFLLLLVALIGYVLRYLQYPMPPLLLGLVLGPLLENSFRLSMELSDTGALIFLQRPVSLALVCVLIFILIQRTRRSVKKRMAIVIGVEE